MALLANLNDGHLFFHYSIDPVYNESDDYILHGHSLYEVYFLVGGKIHYLIEGKKYVPKPGSMLLMKPGVLHGYKLFPGEPYERYALHFDESCLFPEYADRLLRPFTGTESESGCHYSGALLPGFSSLFEALVLCSKMEPEAGLSSAKFALHSLLSHIAYMSRHKTIDAPIETASGAVSEIIRYINENYTRHITLDELSSAYFINKNYLNRLFRSVTGTTVMEYIIRKRIVLSQQLMMKGFSATEAGLRAGFGDYSSFFRAYRRINGHSPICDRIKNIE